jgi:hypothetical protein
MGADMGVDIESKIRLIDPAYLTEIVQEDLFSPYLTITDWTVSRLSAKGINNPDGLWLVSGLGTDQKGLHPWSVVVKILNYPDGKLPAADADWEGRREILVAQTGFTKSLPGPLKAPRFYAVQQTFESAWIWMEYIQTDCSKWGLDEYAFAARQIGQWNGAYLTGTPLPTETWLARQLYLDWIDWVDNQAAYVYPLNQKFIPKKTRQRQEQLWAERETFYRWLECLPQVLSHFDLNRRNLFLRIGPDGQRELFAVDWSTCGIGPIGAELNSLIGTTGILFEWPASMLNRLEEVVIDNYIEGLRQVGWFGDSDLVRLGYTAWLAVWFGCVLPMALTFWTSEEARPIAMQQFGNSGEELLQAYIPLLDFILDRADMARQIVRTRLKSFA